MVFYLNVKFRRIILSFHYLGSFLDPDFKELFLEDDSTRNGIFEIIERGLNIEHCLEEESNLEDNTPTGENPEI